MIRIRTRALGVLAVLALVAAPIAGCDDAATDRAGETATDTTTGSPAAGRDDAAERRERRAERRRERARAKRRAARARARRRAREVRAERARERREREAREAAAAAEAKASEPADDCHPSYEGACLDPSASDYDCEGGSGNGPKYVQGPVRVVGPDEYDLDRDGNGTGCES
ncbi:MAG TPA: hypothetical protein VF520_16785 [Thermoleophilaceae bacterium]